MGREDWRTSRTKAEYVSAHAEQSFFPNGKAEGIDGISAEILKSVPWRALKKIRKALEMRYFGPDKEELMSG